MDGEHCSYVTCGRLSFLPIRCILCSAIFCEEHASPEHHMCPHERNHAQPSARADSAQSPPSARVPCQMQGCRAFSLQVQSSSSFQHRAPRCERCHGLFCMKHRSAQSHTCQASPAQTVGQERLAQAAQRKAKAQVVLAQHFPNYRRG